MDFKAGDRVRIVDTTFCRELSPGMLGTVTEAKEWYEEPVVYVKFDGEEQDYRDWFFARRFELVSPQYKPGDRVKVTVEGFVFDKLHPNDHGLVVNGIYFTHSDIRLNRAIVEIIEPEPTVFGLGDRVKHLDGPGEYLIGRGGYFNLTTNVWFPSDKAFTSDDYEKVD